MPSNLWDTIREKEDVASILFNLDGLEASNILSFRKNALIEVLSLLESVVGWNLRKWCSRKVSFNYVEQIIVNSDVDLQCDCVSVLREHVWHTEKDEEGRTRVYCNEDKRKITFNLATEICLKRLSALHGVTDCQIYRLRKSYTASQVPGSSPETRFWGNQAWPPDFFLQQFSLQEDKIESLSWWHSCVCDGFSASMDENMQQFFLAEIV